MQHKTSSRASDVAASAGLASPLSGLVGIKPLRERARIVLRRAPGQDAFIADLTSVVDRLFAGRFWHYQPIDLKYHDFLHTLQATWTYLDLAEAALEGDALTPAVSPREAELGFAAILLHDSGYLKARGDDEGTGAKYTHSHVLRSCALAASLLPAFGCTSQEIEDVLGAIRCTGLNGNPAASRFNGDHARTIACMVATADYVGQMAAPEYPAKLPYLFTEFSEADDYAGVPPEKRVFSSVTQLLSATSGFWGRFVLPKLENDFAGVHRLLRRPTREGRNLYFEAIEQNLAIIAERVAARSASLSPG